MALEFTTLGKGAAANGTSAPAPPPEVDYSRVVIPAVATSSKNVVVNDCFDWCICECECCEDNKVCKSPKLAICTILCPVVATAVYECGEAEERDEYRPGYELIFPALVGCCQIFCCHVGGIVAACIVINNEEED